MSSLSLFFNDTATTEIYTLSLHDALPISLSLNSRSLPMSIEGSAKVTPCAAMARASSMMAAVCKSDLEGRSEEHTSELQSHSDLVCRLLLEKKTMSGLLVMIS